MIVGLNDEWPLADLVVWAVNVLGVSCQNVS